MDLTFFSEAASVKDRLYVSLVVRSRELLLGHTAVHVAGLIQHVRVAEMSSAVLPFIAFSVPSEKPQHKTTCYIL